MSVDRVGAAVPLRGGVLVCAVVRPVVSCRRRSRNESTMKRSTSTTAGLPRCISVQTAGSTWRVHAEAMCFGDVLVAIWGGEKLHIGAVAAASWPVEPTRDVECDVVGTDVYRAQRGRRGKAGSGSAVRRLGTNVVVTSGLHWDDLPERGIAAIRASCTELVDLVALALTRDPPAG